MVGRDSLPFPCHYRRCIYMSMHPIQMKRKNLSGHFSIEIAKLAFSELEFGRSRHLDAVFLGKIIKDVSTIMQL